MRLFQRLFGYRWSVYFVRNGNELVYVMHENSVIRLIGHLMRRYANGNGPRPPWSIHLNFNRKHKSFELKSNHFTPDAEDLSPALLRQIEEIDPGYKVKGREPILLEAHSKRRIPLSRSYDLSNREALTKSAKEGPKPTLYSVLDEVFGKPASNIPLESDA